MNTFKLDDTASEEEENSEDDSEKIVAKPMIKRFDPNPNPNLSLSRVSDKCHNPGCDFNAGLEHIDELNRPVFERKINKRKAEIENQLIQFYGVVDPLKYDKAQRKYEIFCNENG